MCENICNSGAEVEPLVRACAAAPSLSPQSFNVSLPHCHTQGCHLHAPYPPTQNVLLLDPLLRLQLCLNICMCEHVCARTRDGRTFP